MAASAFETWCQKAMLFAMGVLLVALAAAVPFTDLLRDYVGWLDWPDGLTVLAVAGFVALSAHGGRPRWVWRLVAAACLAAFWGSHRVLSMGDGHLWRQWTAAGDVCYSEPLSSLLHALAYRLLGPQSIEWLAVAIGFAVTWTWLVVTDRWIPPGSRRDVGRARLLMALLWASSGVVALFCHRYVEHTQLGIAPMLLGLAALTNWSRALANGDHTRPRELVVGAALLALAAMTHLQYLAVLGAALFAIFVVAGARLAPGSWLRSLAAVLIAVAVVVGGAMALLLLGPFRIIPGTVAGGADGSYLTMLVDAEGSPFGAGALLSRQHLALCAHVLLLASPVALPAALALLWYWRRLRVPAGGAVLIAAACAWCGFVVLHGFDLGWPIDADLMLSMSPSMSLLIAAAGLQHLVGWRPYVRRGVVVLLLLATVFTWSVVARLSRPVWLDLSQRNSVQATLVVDGIGLDDAAGEQPPYRVRRALGAVVEMQLRGPAGASFGIVKGVPDPACEGHPYGSVADIQVGNDLRAEQFVAAGRFDEGGRATARWQLERLPDGQMPGIQMLVMQGAQHQWPVSAAFYFEAP